MNFAIALVYNMGLPATLVGLMMLDNTGILTWVHVALWIFYGLSAYGCVLYMRKMQETKSTKSMPDMALENIKRNMTVWYYRVMMIVSDVITIAIMAYIGWLYLSVFYAFYIAMDTTSNLRIMKVNNEHSANQR